jgi:hypothetical protein
MPLSMSFHHALVELPFTKLRAKFFTRACGLLPALHVAIRPGISRRRRRGRKQQIEQPLFGGLLGALGYLVELFFAHHVDRGFHQVADHRFHVAAYVAHFGVLRSFHFHERAACEPRKAPRDFGLAHAGGADHQNVFRQNVFRDFGRQLLAAHAIAQRDGDGFLRGVLTYDVLIEFQHDFARRQLVE